MFGNSWIQSNLLLIQAEAQGEVDQQSKGTAKDQAFMLIQGSFVYRGECGFCPAGRVLRPFDIHFQQEKIEWTTSRENLSFRRD